jgi:formamidopyrimidine-DNA glycosylase
VPELPEVETIKRGLEPKLVGQKIEEIMVLRPKQLTECYATPAVHRAQR